MPSILPYARAMLREVTPPGTRRWEELLARLQADVDVVVDRSIERMRGELASYAELDAADLRPVVAADCARLLEHLAERRRPDGSEDVAQFAMAGEVRAAQGVAVHDMLAAFRLALDELRRHAHDVVGPAAEDAPLLLELVELAIAWTDVGMLAAAAGHRQAELAVLRAEQHELANVVRRILFGGASATDLRLAVEAYGLDARAAYHAVRARPGPAAGVSELERFLLGEPAPARRAGLVALVDGDVVGFVARLPAAPAPAAIGVAPAAPLAELGAAFRSATRALDTAIALGARGMFDLGALGLQAAVLADEEVGQALVARYIAPLERQGTSGRVVLQTVERYVANDGRLEVTAQELGVHVNTVRYRLARFEEQTERSLRDNEALVEVWWALQRRRLA